MDVDWSNIGNISDTDFFVLYGKYMANYDALSAEEQAVERDNGKYYMMCYEFERREKASAAAEVNQNQASSAQKMPKEQEAPFGTLRLVLSILAIAIALYAIYQTRFLRIAEALSGGEGFGSVTGVLVAFLMIAGGIVEIIKSKQYAGIRACTILFAIAALFAILMYNDFGDLKYYGYYCAVACIVNYVSARRLK